MSKTISAAATGLPTSPEIIDAEFRNLGIEVRASKEDKITLIWDAGDGYEKARSSGLIERAKEIRAEYLAYLRTNGRTI